MGLRKLSAMERRAGGEYVEFISRPSWFADQITLLLCEESQRTFASLPSFKIVPDLHRLAEIANAIKHSKT